MPNLVGEGLSIKDVRARYVPFRRVRHLQVFYAQGRWWQKRTKRTAIRADDNSTEYAYFRLEQQVRVFDETKPLLQQVPGISFEEFIRRSALS